MTNIHFPKLSDYDPVTSAEGALDPLGLYAIADSLAMRLVPGMRERMSHPRFLTAMAVGNGFTRQYDEDVLAADGQSEPYIVYEWHVVEGIIRTRGKDPQLSGLPGTLKARDCLRDGLSLSAPRYLKTATVFGFHGVYRLLADNLDIIKNGYLGENGYQLLSIWEKEQDLTGFVNGDGGPGLSRRQQLQAAMTDALKKGSIDRSGTWEGWNFFGNHLFPNAIPPLERDMLKRFLLSQKDSSRAQVIRFLVSDKGKKTFQIAKSERVFHKALMPFVDEETHHLIETIAAYETFSRILQDALDDCLAAMTHQHGRISPRELATTPGCQNAYKRVPAMFNALADRLEPYSQTVRFTETFGTLAENTSAELWIQLLFDHHVRIQRQKPPHGKNAWFERFDDGSLVIRAGYRRTAGGHHDTEYVHSYRTNSLLSFAIDLGMIL